MYLDSKIKMLELQKIYKNYGETFLDGGYIATGQFACDVDNEPC